MQCLQCDSKRIVKNVHVLDIGESHMRNTMKVEVFEKPKALLFKGAHQADVFANVCANCGFVMLSVSVADAEVLERHQKN